MQNTTVKVRKAQVRPVIEATFPDYKGRRFEIEFTPHITFRDTNWGGGTRNQYAAVSGDGQVKTFTAPAPWINPIEGKRVELPENVLIVCHTVFCGQDLGITIYANPCYLPKWLPAEV